MHWIFGLLAFALPAAELATTLTVSDFLDTVAPLWIRWQSSMPALFAIQHIDHLADLLKSL